MLDDLQRLFRDTLAAFRTELARSEPEDQVAELLGAMRRELVAARAALPEYEDAAQRARAELAAERESLALAERRGALAEKIGDAETARVASEFVARHRERVTVLETKAEAAQAEWELRRRDAEEMKTRYQQADNQRFALLAQLRRQAAGQRTRSALDAEEGVFADFERVQETVERDAAVIDALDELDPSGPATRPPDVDERLRELKRRMGKE